LQKYDYPAYMVVISTISTPYIAKICYFATASFCPGNNARYRLYLFLLSDSEKFIDIFLNICVGKRL